MSFLRNSSNLRICLGVLASVAVFTYLAHNPSTSISAATSGFSMADRAAQGPIAGLSISIGQTSSSPPTVLVTVENKNSEPVTILSYGSALDPLALQTGLLSIKPDGAQGPLDIPKIQVQRQWPPPADAVIGIEAGGSARNEIVLREPIVPMEKVGGKAAVQLKGRWDAVWAKDKGGVNAAALESGSTDGDAFSGNFESDEIEITVS